MKAHRAERAGLRLTGILSYCLRFHVYFVEAFIPPFAAGFMMIFVWIGKGARRHLIP